MQFVIQAMLVKLRIRSRTFFSRYLCSLVFFQPAAENVIKHLSPYDSKKIKDCIKKTQALVTEHLFNIIQKKNLALSHWKNNETDSHLWLQTGI